MRGERMLKRGRKRALERMSETVTVGWFEFRRLPGSLDQVLTLVETFYVGEARVKFPSASAMTKNPAGQQLIETNIVVSLPAGTITIPPGSFVRVDGSRADPTLIGRKLRVDGPAQSGQTTAHRYPVVEES